MCSSAAQKFCRCGQSSEMASNVDLSTILFMHILWQGEESDGGQGAGGGKWVGEEVGEGGRGRERVGEGSR